MAVWQPKQTTLHKNKDITCKEKLELKGNNVNSNILFHNFPQVCCFSPDGATILSGYNDNTLKLWRVCDGSLINTLNGHTSYVSTTKRSSWFSCNTGHVLLFFT